MLFQPSDQSLTVYTPAKLNLFLDVRGRRQDGYHELETFMVAVNLYDTLRLRAEESGEVRLRVIDVSPHRGSASDIQQQVPSDGQNLVVRAARLLQAHAGITRGVRIDLLKRIPAAAGLGGGSSDAAAALCGLNRFWNLNLSNSELQRLSHQLGSDIAFFVAGTPAAICRGRGELIEPVPLRQCLHFVIARPQTGLSTAAVYQHCRPSVQPKSCENLVRALRAGRLACAAGHFFNRLQTSAEELNVDVQRLTKVFSDEPVLGHLMSGSGTAYFGLCRHLRHARAIAARLQASGIGRVCVAQSRA